MARQTHKPHRSRHNRQPGEDKTRQQQAERILNGHAGEIAVHQTRERERAAARAPDATIVDQGPIRFVGPQALHTATCDICSSTFETSRPDHAKRCSETCRRIADRRRQRAKKRREAIARNGAYRPWPAEKRRATHKHIVGNSDPVSMEPAGEQPESIGRRLDRIEIALSEILERLSR
ncbi:MAG: hypothetical protein OXH70_17690 [Acidobacteria bacterium]|nr:hypothetical protein [Acidobacteriota bacterium]